MEEIDSEQWLKDLPIQTEEIAFKPEDLISCAKCGRTNPPTRSNCFYCNAELEFSLAQSQFLKPNLRKLESWEKGFNLIVLSGERTFDETNAAEIFRLLNLEKESAAKILVAQIALPAARVESEREAEILQTRLRDSGIESLVLSDETLAADKFPRRLRGIEFFDDKMLLILFNEDKVVEISNQDLVLIITGAVFERRLQASEKYNKKGENKILDTSETASDEKIIDIYTKQNAVGFRILAKGFDFSGLGAEKGILATENIKKLAEKLRQFSPNAKFVSDYLKVRENLAFVWEVEQKNNSHGLKRESFGNFTMESVTTISNLSQFTKYSRLQWNLL